MKRVTGIGGIFFLSPDAKRLRAWYGKHLGLTIRDWGGCSFEWREKDAPRRVGSTVWSIMDATSKYFAPSRERFMVNYRVANLDRVLAALKREGIDAKREDSEFGRFAWIFDPEGRKLELWEPPAPEKKSRKKTRRKKKSASRRRA